MGKKNGLREEERRSERGEWAYRGARRRVRSCTAWLRPLSRRRGQVRTCGARRGAAAGSRWSSAAGARGSRPDLAAKVRLGEAMARSGGSRHGLPGTRLRRESFVCQW
ncbi:uncharacterized protein M6B38_369230 [Iris pallida]|uniref:Uncharacterized protein n=1 Tax=Iris pallida TaxID=29817 RepID=A0AAX6GDJ2_IRIPA|nr:uncharacterized protein M6B38_369230 [Iris pallida]